VCSGSVINGVPGADYSSCTSDAQFGTCTPVCLPGYTAIGAASGFASACDGNGDLNAASDTGDLVCSINGCNGNVVDGVDGADYSSCMASPILYGVCAPVCLPGYITTGASAGLLVNCMLYKGDLFASFDRGTLACTATTTTTLTTETTASTTTVTAASQVRTTTQGICTGTVFNGVAGADYSPCMSAAPFAICTPVCLPGYATSGASSGFFVNCLHYNGILFNFDRGNLECTANTCSGSVIDGVENADYSSCTSAVTGDSCTPKCPTGAVSTSIPLVCQANGNFDAAARGCEFQMVVAPQTCLTARGWRARGVPCQSLKVRDDAVSAEMTKTSMAPEAKAKVKAEQP
jgi:hypothetical protein